ncbi:MAG: hypothetical protein Q8K58_12415 [Acidimicrobiales bacterium]|nr:hypothetical protein [Acidimicrobiales bacterium]
MKPRLGPPPDGESDRGVVVILVTLLLFALVAVTAIVIDLGALRSSAQANQNIADFAALTAGRTLMTEPATACQAAVGSVNANAKLSPAINAVTFCAPMGTTTCTGGAAAQVTPSATVGKYTVSMHYPVPDTEIPDARIVGGVRLNDGPACQRFRVLITSRQQTLFAGILRSGDLSATRSATARPSRAVSIKPPAMWMLDPTGCTALSVTGGSRVTAGSSTVAGVITIDSDGSGCASNQVTVSSSGAGSLLQAVSTSSEAGEIDLFALPPAATACTGTACSPADVDAGRLVPQPVSTVNRATRAIVDDVYNCHAVDPYSPFHGINLVSSCDPSTTSPYIDQLKSAVGTSGVPVVSFGGGPGYQQWSPTHSCNAPAGDTLVTGNWWINCPSGLSVGNLSTVQFANGNVVIDNGIKMTGGALSFNQVPNAGNLSNECLIDVCIGRAVAGASFVYLRSGDIAITGGVLTASHTMIYSKSGYVQVNSSPPIWLAPTQGPFNYLALWSDMPATSNNVGKFAMAGGAGVQLSGVFFTPEAAPFTLSGGGTWGQQQAQFVSYRLHVSGGGDITLSPDPQNAVNAPSVAPTLIR